MAGVFLSYDRDDNAAAKVIATALEAAGHSVWWDLHVRGGAQFAKVIEEALKAADAVVVLWSKNSVESAWVRDEAAAGRDSSRLVPASIDGTQAPLGFRQFQTIPLSDWKRSSRSRGYQDVERAVVELGGGRRPDVLPENRRPEGKWRASPLWVAAIPSAAAFAGATYFLWPASSMEVPTVAVVPASNSAASQELSRDLLAKLGVLQGLNRSELQLVDEGASGSADLVFKVDAPNDATKATLLLLSGRTRDLLWSGDFNQESGNESDLKQQLAYRAANVLDCASDVYGSAGKFLDWQTRRLYLTGCGAFTQVAGEDLEDLIRTFREVTRRAPRFEGAWSRLIEAEDQLLFSPPFSGDTPEAQSALWADIGAARKLNPDMASAYIAEGDLAAQRGFVESLRLTDLAAERNPDDADALGARSNDMLQVGRLNDAVADARRAVRLRPFSPLAQESYISALTYSGQFDAARQELSKAEALFPGASNLSDARYRLNLRYGSPQDALKQLRQGGIHDFGNMESYLQARIDPTPANVERAVELARKQLNGDSLNTGNYIQTLATFGRNDEIFDFLMQYPQSDRHGRFVGVLFRPAFRGFWHDPRSMKVAAGYGLVDYWRSSGHWPDFCSWPDLPYDCKREAAKLN